MPAFTASSIKEKTRGETNGASCTPSAAAALPAGLNLVPRPWWYPGYYLVSTCALVLYWLRSRFSREARQNFQQRCWQERQVSDAESTRIWLHGASLGELQGLSPLIDLLSQRYGADALVVTTTSRTGQAKLAAQFPEIPRSLLPFDQPGVVKKWLKTYQPKQLIVAETEFWPAMFVEANLAGVSIFLVNGRVSDRAFPRYRYLRFLLKDLFKRVRWVGVASPTDQQRFLALGMSANHLECTGSTKFDREFSLLSPTQKESLLEETSLAGVTPLIVAASVRPGEDEAVVDAFQLVRQRFPRAGLVLAPRHPEQSAHLDKLLSARGLDFRRRAVPSGAMTPPDVFVLDTLGELLKFFQLSDIVFVGGTLVPVGGHNPFEAIAYQRPVIVGPWTQNVRDAIGLLRQAEAIAEVSDARELAEKLTELLANPELTAKLVRNATAVLISQQGAVGRVLTRLLPLLETH